MSVSISVRVDVRAASEGLNVTALRLRQVIAQALSNTVLIGREEAARRIAEQYGITQRQAGTYTKTDRASASTLAATLTISDLRIRASKLDPVQTATGVRYSIPGGQSGERRHAFIATMRSGHTGVFLRTTRPARKRGPKPNRSYLPIAEQTVRIPATVPPGLLPFLQARAETELKGELERLAIFAGGAQRAA